MDDEKRQYHFPRDFQMCDVGDGHLGYAGHVIDEKYQTRTKMIQAYCY